MTTNDQTNIQIAELRVEAETVRYHREPPPPYSFAGDIVTTQPIINQTIIIQAPLKDRPLLYECPACQERVLTKVIYVNSRKTHLVAGFICGFTCWCLLCCLAGLPYILPRFKKAQHYCPSCNKFLGSYTKL